MRDKALTQDEDLNKKEDKDMTLDRKIWIYMNLRDMANDLLTLHGRRYNRIKEGSHLLEIAVKLLEYYESHDDINL